MRARRVVFSVSVVTVAFMALIGGLAALAGVDATDSPQSSPGRIAFAREVPRGSDETYTFTVNQDGTGMKRLYTAGQSGSPHWSPDGRSVAVNAGCTDGQENCAFTIVDAKTRKFRQVKMRTPGLSTSCNVWSPSGTRLACGGYGEPDPTRSGIYTMRVSDGGGLVRVTRRSSGYDEPGDYSPRGTEIVLARYNKDEKPLGLFIVRANGRQLRRIAPAAPQLSSGDWSPSGKWILFARRVNHKVHNSLWVVRPNGNGLHELKLQGFPPCGGALSDLTTTGCIHPRWSPDGTKIVFDLASFKAGHEVETIYIADADGTGVTQVTRGGWEDDAPDWEPPH
jgi:Tol biopolymer transport system component